MTRQNCGGASGQQPSQMNTGGTGGGQSHDHNLSANFVGSSTSTLSPYLVLIYIIKT
jgi:hypothetical protein